MICDACGDPKERHMQSLSKHQFSVLKRLANSPVKVYCTPAGIPSDKKCDEISQDFNDILHLVELSLMSDVSDWDKYLPIIKQYRDEGNRDVAIVILNALGGRMFGRVRHDKWIN